MSRPRIGVDKSQYFVSGGGDPEQPDLSVLPGLLIGMGQYGFAVITGLEAGVIPVEIQPLSEPPGAVDQSWDAVGEVTIDSPGGSISVAGWSLPVDEESTELAASGPGLHRVRVHVRDRANCDPEDSTERHLLQAWPVSEAAPPALLRGLDTFGRYFTGELKPPEPELDAVNLAVASAVEVLAEMVESGVRPSVSGQVVTLRHHAVIEASPTAVYEIVSSPVAWVGIGGSPGFHVLFSNPVLGTNDPTQNSRQVHARGKTLNDTADHVSFSWAWLVPILPPGQELDLKERLHAILTGMPFPDRPEIIDVRLTGLGGSTDVELTISGVPVEHVEVTNAVWAWAMKRLTRRAAKRPAEMFPWGNYY